MVLNFIKFILGPIVFRFKQFFTNSILLLKNHSLKIGLNTRIIDSEVGINNFIGSNSSLVRSKLGNYSYISKNSTIFNAEIGKFCSIAENVSIAGGVHPTQTFVSTHPVFYSIKKQCGITFTDKNYFNEFTERIVIGNDVWIGKNTIILNNTKIGDGSIIAAGSVVTKDVPPFSIYGGVPAKKIKDRFSQQQISILSEDRWWDKDESWLRKNYLLMHDITDYINHLKL